GRHVDTKQRYTGYQLRGGRAARDCRDAGAQEVPQLRDDARATDAGLQACRLLAAQSQGRSERPERREHGRREAAQELAPCRSAHPWCKAEGAGEFAGADLRRHEVNASGTRFPAMTWRANLLTLPLLAICVPYLAGIALLIPMSLRQQDGWGFATYI